MRFAFTQSNRGGVRRERRGIGDGQNSALPILLSNTPDISLVGIWHECQIQLDCDENQ